MHYKSKSCPRTDNDIDKHSNHFATALPKADLKLILILSDRLCLCDCLSLTLTLYVHSLTPTCL